LGGEVGAVAASPREVEKEGVAAQGPGLGVVDGALTVVGLDKDHGRLLSEKTPKFFLPVYEIPSERFTNRAKYGIMVYL
jgi:hypothetical protein